MQRNRKGIMDEDFAVCMESLQSAAKKTNDVRSLLNDANVVAKRLTGETLPSHLWAIVNANSNSIFYLETKK